MDELLDILNEINSDIDYDTVTDLIDGRWLDSFSIITLITELSDTFDIEIGPKYLVPENFNSVDAMWNMIQMLQDEE